MVTTKRLSAYTMQIFFLFLVIFSGCRQTPLAPEPKTSANSQKPMTPAACTPIRACEDPVKIVTPESSDGLPGSLVYDSLEGFHLVGGTPLADRCMPVSEPSESIAGLVGFSPSGKWVAYYTGSAYEGHPYKLHLISARGEEVTTIPAYEIVPVQKGNYDGAWDGVRWITNDYMLVGVSDPVKNYSARITIAIINPFTGEWQESILEDLPARYPEGGIAFDSALKRVLYVARLENEDGVQVPTMVLWDLEYNTELWRGDHLYPSGLINRWGGAAAWSPNGSVVAFVGPEAVEPSKGHNDDQGIYILDRDGIETQLATNFRSNYESFSVDGLLWSPNSRYLVFRLMGRTTLEAEAIRTIYLYDSMTNQVSELCSIHAAGLSITGEMYWSPDSRYLAFVSEDFPPRSLYVIDLCTGKVVEVTKSIGQVGGWSDAFP